MEEIAPGAISSGLPHLPLAGLSQVRLLPPLNPKPFNLPRFQLQLRIEPSGNSSEIIVQFINPIVVKAGQTLTVRVNW
jgi:hypothetical protein